MRGLVALQSRVRGEIARGLDRSALGLLATEVAGELVRVDEGLRRLGARITSLAAPSRNAYRYLRDLDFTAVPSGTNRRVAAIRINGLVAGYAKVADALSADEPDLGPIRESAKAMLARADVGLARREATVRELPDQSAAAYRALEDLVTPGRAEALNDTWRRGRRQFANAIAGDRRRRVSHLDLRFRPTSTIWRWRAEEGRATVTLNHLLIGAPDDVLESIVSWCLGRASSHGRAAVERWISESARNGRLTPADSQPVGVAHHLGELFDRLNETYFDGELHRPGLSWTSRPTHSKFGHYTFADDRVVISSSLDHPAVSEQLVAYVLYHELLHKALDRSGIHGVRPHNAEFRRREKLFDGFVAAEKELEKLARRLRR